MFSYREVCTTRRDILVQTLGQIKDPLFGEETDTPFWPKALVFFRPLRLNSAPGLGNGCYFNEQSLARVFSLENKWVF